MFNNQKNYRMKTRLTLFLIFLSLSYGFAQRDVSPTIISALQKGDAVAVSAFFNENVELIVGQVNDVFSKKQATGILSDFFRRNKISSFRIIHKGNKENSAFSICSMQAGSASYRVYILVRTADNQQLIQQLRIEPTNDQ
jgi:mRNA-degrading endonuclease RelE of RelBE toxin-antitoxin system